jgi:hypothetical protein
MQDIVFSLKVSFWLVQNPSESRKLSGPTSGNRYEHSAYKEAMKNHIFPLWKRGIKGDFKNK